MRNRYATRLLAAGLLLLSWLPVSAQTTVKKVVLQGFWWDYYNGNYPFKWADYLTDLAPRLKQLGVDAVWIPPTPKNKNATNDVGYSPFDHYDLGDKYQKGAARTRFGSKDEFLRMVAVLHANGIEVIQDVVLNHADGAGTAAGAGGQDPEPLSMATNSGYKTFRYSCFGTPLPETADDGTAYLSRQGRWPKNYPNFHPHLGHQTDQGDMAAPYFGPDFCYGNDGGNDGYGGLSSQVLAQYPSAYNPVQAPGYSQTQARSWVQWLKKQTGVDGFRWDAVKHFSYNAQQDLSYNLKYNTDWANGGEAMYNVGEYVGGKGDLDNYVTSVKTRNNGQDFLMGTFDFGLRGAVYGMVQGGGGYDLGQIPGQQQDQRVAYYSNSNTFVHRTAPFVNNHDTFRPRVDATGNYTGWNSGDELAAHIDPFDPRLSAAYAITFAVDGNPQIFFEDLFNIGGTGKRWSHLPASTTDLPVRDDLVNLLWCHQHLGFKDGAYKVRHQSPDHLIIERSSKAIIGINDNWDTWQETYVDSDFAPGTVLKDYSGANGSFTYTVPQDRRVRINTPPCNGTAVLGRRGYSVWAPVGQDNSSYAPPRSTATTQEWEMADDLGDLNCQSLGQGGRLPDNSTNARLTGKIYAQAGQPLTYELYPESTSNTRSITVGVYDLRGNQLSTASGTTAATGTYTPTTTGWLSLKVRNTSNTYAGQRCFVKATYTAPAAVDTRATAAPSNTVAIWTGNDNSVDVTDCRNWENGVTPSATTDVLVPAGTAFMPAVSSGTLAARNLTIEAGATVAVAAGTTLRITGNLVSNGSFSGVGTVAFTGSTTQTLSGSGLAFSNLTISNAADVSLLAPISVAGSLTFSSGHLLLNEQNLTLNSTATLNGVDAARYVVTRDVASSGGFVVRPVPADGSVVDFPVGTAASYTPLRIRNTGTATDFRVRTFSGLLENGTTGAPYARTPEFVNRTWEITPAGAAPVADLTFQWNSTEENSAFRRGTAQVYRNPGGTGSTWSALPTTAAVGSDPYTVLTPAVSSFSKFSIGNGAGPLPVSLVRFEAKRANPTTVLLTWATASEQQNKAFEVEKSADGREFRLVGTLAGQGTSTQARTYQLIDAAAPTAAYYRLRQLDTNGHATYSTVVFVAADGLTFSLYPNPTAGTVTLTGTTSQLVTMRLASVYDREVLPARTGLLPVLNEALNHALRAAAPGVYMVTLEAGGQRQHLRLVKQ